MVLYCLFSHQTTHDWSPVNQPYFGVLLPKWPHEHRSRCACLESKHSFIFRKVFGIEDNFWNWEQEYKKFWPKMFPFILALRKCQRFRNQQAGNMDKSQVCICYKLQHHTCQEESGNFSSSVPFELQKHRDLSSASTLHESTRKSAALSPAQTWQRRHRQFSEAERT